MEVRPLRFATRDPASAEEFLRARWESLGEVELGPDFSLEVSGVQAPQLRVERFAHTSSLRATTTTAGPVQVVEVLGGSLVLEDGDRVLRFGPGDLVAIDAETTPLSTSRAVHVGVVTLARELLAEVAGVPAGRLRVPARAPESAQAAGRWREAVRRCNREITDHLRRGGSPPREVAVRLAEAAVEVFGFELAPGSDQTSSVPEDHPVARATAYIEANAPAPMSVADIADAARTSVRALQQGFARHHDTSPTAYLRRVRLEGARRELASADPDGPVTVADVAARWGFSQAGRFAAHYRDEFGVLPSETLRQRPHSPPRVGGAEWPRNGSAR